MFGLVVLVILVWVVAPIIKGRSGVVFSRFFWRFVLFLIYLTAGIQANHPTVKTLLVSLSFLILLTIFLPLVSEFYRGWIGEEEGAPSIAYLLFFFFGILVSYLSSKPGIEPDPFFGMSLPCALISVGFLIYYGITLPNLMVKRRINKQLERTDQLRLLENSIKSLASKLNVSFPTDYEGEVQRYINNRKVELLLSDLSGLRNLISENIKQASEDSYRLGEALRLYNSAEEVYKKVSYEVRKIMPFVKILEDIYERLNSENVKSILIARKWKEYEDVINTTIEILKDLEKQAENYQEGGYEEEGTEETDVERAYRFLGVPPTATDEQIKKMYKLLVLMWHPDTGGDNEHMTDINWAYDILRKERNIT